MDTLIRSARLAPFRRRLSETGGNAPSATAAGAVEAGRRDTLRDQIEEQVRAELTADMQLHYESERERAHADGYADALAAANAVTARELASAREQLQAKVDGALSALEHAHRAVLAKLESSVGEVAFAAVCRLVGNKATSRALVSGLIERMCSELRAEAIATARLHPRDIELLGELLQGHEMRVRSLALKVVPDESLALGGCVIEASSGEYDGGLESQLRRLHAVLTGAPRAHNPIASTGAVAPVPGAKG